MRTFLIAAFVATIASAQVLREGATCNGIAGPIYGRCGAGLECRMVHADLGTCQPIVLSEGATCSGIAGPIYGTCGFGLECRPVHADLATCQKAILHEGQTCSGIAGPIYGVCASGLECVSLGPDNSVCRRVPAAAAAAENVAASRRTLGEGETCDGFAGPIYGTCAAGLQCVSIGADNSVCRRVPAAAAENAAASATLGFGDLCSGIAGPIYGQCGRGLECVSLGPDHSVCQWRQLERGQSCVTIAGRMGVCRAPYHCTFVAADYSVCA
eukprot:m51a1_g2171 hypothetical protein (270) ;mRNA; f:68316-69125